MTKACSICNVEKELDKFYKRKDALDGYEGNCKECREATRRKTDNFYSNRNKATRKHDAKRKGKRGAYHLSKTYGLSMDDYSNMKEEQDHKCLICKQPNDEDMHYGKFVVDHCHKTGKVRGLLCNKCNLMLGNARDEITILEEGIRYLKERG